MNQDAIGRLFTFAWVVPDEIRDTREAWEAWAKVIVRNSRPLDATTWLSESAIYLRASGTVHWFHTGLVRPELEKLTGYLELHTREDAIDALRVLPCDAIPTVAVMALLECDVWGSV